MDVHEKSVQRAKQEAELASLLAEDLPTNFEFVVLTYTDELIKFVSVQYDPRYAEDIVQETFLNAYNALQGFSPDKIRRWKIRSWLYTIARNRFYNHHSRDERLETVSMERLEGLELLSTEFDGQYPSPDREVEQREEYHELYECIRHLPLLQRQSVYLHYIACLEYKEIAIIMNKPFNTVKSYGNRGFKLLRTMMRKGGK